MCFPAVGVTDVTSLKTWASDSTSDPCPPRPPPPSRAQLSGCSQNPHPGQRIHRALSLPLSSHRPTTRDTRPQGTLSKTKMSHHFRHYAQWNKGTISPTRRASATHLVMHWAPTFSCTHCPDPSPSLSPLSDHRVSHLPELATMLGPHLRL